MVFSRDPTCRGRLPSPLLWGINSVSLLLTCTYTRHIHQAHTPGTSATALLHNAACHFLMLVYSHSIIILIEGKDTSCRRQHDASYSSMAGLIMGSTALCAAVLPHVSLPQATLLPHALKELSETQAQRQDKCS